MSRYQLFSKKNFHQKDFLRALCRVLGASMVVTLGTTEKADCQSQQPQQVWVKVANENDTVAIKSGTTIRYGAAPGICAAVFGTCKNIGDPTPGGWSSFTATTDITGSANADNFGGDPANGQVKEVDVLETLQVQTVEVNGNIVTIPALTVPVPAKTTVVYNNAGYVISLGQQQDLTVEELDQLKFAQADVENLYYKYLAAQKSLQTLQNSLMKSHGCTDITKPCSLNYDHSVQTTYEPAR